MDPATVEPELCVPGPRRLRLRGPRPGYLRQGLFALGTLALLALAADLGVTAVRARSLTSGTLVGVVALAALAAASAALAAGITPVQAGLVCLGRPVLGRIRRREEKGRERWLSYEFTELGLPESGRLRTGLVEVTPAEYEAAAAGAPVTVLYALWDPDLHVPYAYAPLAAVAQPEARWK